MVVGLFTTSCVKEEITPNSPIQPETETEEISQDIHSLESDNSLLNSDFTIEIVKTACATGYTYTVTSPEVDLSNGNYTITWFKNTELTTFSTGQELECVCGFGVRVEVFDEINAAIGAKDSFDIPGC